MDSELYARKRSAFRGGAYFVVTMITKTAIALAGVLAAATVLVPSTASAQVETPCQWAQLQDGAWVCVPDTPQTYTYDDTPYAYYYVPYVGWGWHVSPWGFGHAWHGRYNASYGHYVPRYHGGAHYSGGGAHYSGGAHYGGGHYGGGHAAGGHGGGHGGGHR
jgi:uncharacterized membrane protein YgcG